MLPDDPIEVTTPRRAIPRRLRFEIFRRDGHACRYCGAMAPDVKLTVDHVVPVALGGSDDPTNLVTACTACNSGKAASSPDEAIVADVAEDALRWRRAMETAAIGLLVERDLVNELCERFLAEWNKWTFGRQERVDPEPVEPTGNRLIDNWHHTIRYSSHCRPVDFSDGVLLLQVERGWLTEIRKEFKLVGTRRSLSELLGQPIERVEVTEGWPGPIPLPPGPTWRTVRVNSPLPQGWEDSVSRFVSLGLPEEEMHRLVKVAMEKTLREDDRFRFFRGCCWRALTDLQEDARRILEAKEKR